MLVVTSIYAGLLVFVLVTLSVRVILYRRANMISLGDADDKALRKRMRAHSNFTEYAPFGLVLLALIEMSGAPSVAVHVLGAMLLLGRILHAWGFSSTPQVMPARQLGMMLTFMMMNLSALGLLAHALF